MKNYRKAKRGEIRCIDCRYVRGPDSIRGWHRCSYSVPHYAIGKKNTCDYAKAAEAKEE